MSELTEISSERGLRGCVSRLEDSPDGGQLAHIPTGEVTGIQCLSDDPKEPSPLEQSPQPPLVESGVDCIVYVPSISG